MKKNIRIALLDQKNNFGGGERFAQKLLKNFENYTDNISIDYYGNLTKNKLTFYKNYFKKIKIFRLRSLILKSQGIFNIQKSEKLISILQDRFKKLNKYLPYYISGNLKKEMEKRLNNYDVVFFLWPYFIEMPNIRAKKIIILHDLNFKYYFSGQSTFDLNQVNILNRNLKNWLISANVIVTSNFMKNEFFKFYPKFNNKIKVIRMGSFTQNYNSYKKKKFKNLNFPFLLCPSSTLGHKNISNLIRAFNIIKKKYSKIKLVFTGPGTEILNGNVFNNFLELNKSNNSIIGLGYINNDYMDFLIKKAKVVVNCSIYEPGNGSGLDSWALGSLVAMSNIPAFREHINFLNVRAELFNPFDPKDIAKKIIKLLNLSKKQKKLLIDQSKKMIHRDNWKEIVKEYINFINIK